MFELLWAPPFYQAARVFAFVAAVMFALRLTRATWPLPGRLVATLAIFATLALWGGALQHLGDRQPGKTTFEESDPPVAEDADDPMCAQIAPAAKPPLPDDAPAPAPGPPCHHGSVTLNYLAIAKTASQVVLGRDNLMQAAVASSADGQHFAISRNAGMDGSARESWSIASLSTRRRLQLIYCNPPKDPAETDCLSRRQDEVRLYADRLEIAKGDKLQFSPETGAGDELEVKDVAYEKNEPNAGTLDFVMHRVKTASEERYRLTWSPTALSLQGPNGEAIAGCGASSFAAQESLRDANRILRGRFRALQEEAIFLRIGGELDCMRHGVATVSIPGAAFSLAAIGFSPKIGFVFALGNDPGARVLRAHRVLWLNALDHGFFAELRGARMQLQGFVAGKTTYAVDWIDEAGSGAAMRIRAVDDAHRLDNVQCVQDSQIDLVGASALPYQTLCRDVPRAARFWAKYGVPHPLAAAIWNGFRRAPLAFYRQPGRRVRAIAAVAAGLALAFFALAWRNGWVETAGPLEALARWGAIVAATGLLLDYLAWKQIDFYSPSLSWTGPKIAPDPPWLALHAWAFAALAAASARGGEFIDAVALAVVTSLLAFGHFALMALSLDAPDATRLRFVDDTTHAIVAVAAVIVIFSQLGPALLASGLRSLVEPLAFRRPPANFLARFAWNVVRRICNALGLPLGLIALGGFTVLCLALWFALGTETGISGAFQMSELVKSLVVVLLAAAVTLALDRERNRPNDLDEAPAAARQGLRALWRWGPPLALAALAAVVMQWRQPLGAWVHHPSYVEIFGLALGLAALVYAIVSVRNPMWSAFLLIAGVLTAILVLPVFRNDYSAFIVILVTALATLVVVVIVHGAALFSEWLEERNWEAPPPPDVWRSPRRRYEAEDWLRRTARASRTLPRAVAGGVAGRPFELAAVAAVAAFALAAVYQAQTLAVAGAARAGLISELGAWRTHEKPIFRFVSWIELNAEPDAAGKTIDVEFVDVARQALDSREAIAGSGCGDWTAPAPPFPGAMAFRALAPVADVLRPAAGLAARGLDALAEAAGCRLSSAAALSRHERDRAALAREKAALSTPEIQNDFIGAWLVVALGRNGAIVVVVMQCALVGLMFLTAFRTVKWTRAHVRNRPAASVAAFSVIGFAIMLATQSAISWANALALLPVMGQPATFLSHGPSHLLFFGAPAVLACVSALRVRSVLKTQVESGAIPPAPWPWLFLLRRRGSAARRRRFSSV